MKCKKLKSILTMIFLVCALGITAYALTYSKVLPRWSGTVTLGQDAKSQNMGNQFQHCVFLIGGDVGGSYDAVWVYAQAQSGSNWNKCSDDELNYDGYKTYNINYTSTPNTGTQVRIKGYNDNWVYVNVSITGGLAM